MIWNILAIVIAVIVIIGLFRMIFSEKRGNSVLDLVMDLFLLDVIGDMFGVIIEVLGDIFSDIDL